MIVAYASLNYLFARTLTAAAVGVSGYLINLFYNFRVYGKTRMVPIE